MSLGTGVFLSSLVLATVILYTQTKDRWGWRRTAKWSAITGAGLAVLIGLTVWAYLEIESRPTIQSELWGIQLGQSKRDVRLAKGEPKEALNENIWRYVISQDSSYVVGFKGEAVRYVLFDGARLYAPTVAGLNAYSSAKDIESRLGKPNTISISPDELRQWWSFEKYRVAMLLEKGEIVAVGIFDPAYGPVRFSKEAESASESTATN